MQKLTDNIYLLVILSMLGTFGLMSSFVWLLLRNQRKLMEQKEKMAAAELDHQRQLLRSVIESQEAERIRIGQDLHDDVGTALSNLRITGERYTRLEPDNESLNELVDLNKRIVDKIISNVRAISHNLSPEIFTVHTLSEAIEELFTSIHEASGLTILLLNEAEAVLDTMDLTTALVIYRVLEELLNNTLKHAMADTIQIDIRKAGRHLHIDYRDNGKGMPAGPDVKKGRGLQNIESRLGIVQAHYTIDPSAFPGFHFQLRIPVPDK